MHWGDWEIDNEESYRDDFDAVPSNIVDERTVHARIFSSKEEAIKFGKNLLEEKKQGEEYKWIAYIEVKECHITVIEKVK